MLDRATVYDTPGLWIRAVYMEGFKNKSITAVVRIKDRTDPKNPNYIPPDQDIAVRFIEKPGNQAESRGPVFFPDDGTTVRRTASIVKTIGELTAEDLAGTAPDTATAELVRYHLATINDTPLPSFDTVVTIWRFEYAPNAVDE